MAQKQKIIISASDKTKAAYNSVQRNTEQLNRSFGKLHKAMSSVAILYAGSQTVKAIANVSDNYRRMNAQIRLVTDANGDAQKTFKDLLELANETRSSLDGSVIGYARMQRATAGLSVSQKDLLTATKAINQSFRISGATQKEAYNATIQLSQGIASGALRGEEFNAISEQAPRLMKAMRDEFGKTDGELRAMSKRGEITSEMILQALINQSKNIQKEFNVLPVLVSEAMTQLANDATAAFGKVDASPLVDAINELRDLVTDEDFAANMIILSEVLVNIVALGAKAASASVDAAKVIGEAFAGAAVGQDLDIMVAKHEKALEEWFAVVPKGSFGVLQLSNRVKTLEEKLKSANEALLDLKAEDIGELSGLMRGLEGLGAAMTPLSPGPLLPEPKEMHNRKLRDALAEVIALENKLANTRKDLDQRLYGKKDPKKQPKTTAAKIEYDQNNRWYKATLTLAEKYYADLASIEKDFGDKKISEETARRSVNLAVENYQKQLDEKRKAQTKEYDDLVRSLRSQEEVTAESYQRGLKLLEDNISNKDALKAAQDKLTEKLYPQENFWEGLVTDADSAMERIKEINRSMIDDFSSGLGDLAVQTMLYSEDSSDAFTALGRSMVDSVVSSLVEMAAQWVIYQTVQAVSDKALKASQANSLIMEANAASVMAGLHAYKSTAAIPVVGPPAAPAAAAAAIAATSPMAATVSSLALAGIAHGGMTSVPSESTYLLDKGERVLSPNQNKDLVNFMGEKSEQKQEVNVNFFIEAIDTTGATAVINSQRGQIVSIVRGAIREAGGAEYI